MIKIEIKHNYKFSETEIFDAFLNVNIAKHFMFRTINGKLVTANLTPETGGEFTFEEERTGDDQKKFVASHFGTYVEIERPQRLTFVFSTAKNSDTSDYVELAFQKTDAGSEIILNQDIAPEFLEHKKKIENGWVQILEKLDVYLTNQKAQANVGTAALPKDSLGNEICEGDSVKTIKDLNVKGSSMVIKRGTIVKKVRLIVGNDEEVDCKVDGIALSLETQWLAKI